MKMLISIKSNVETHNHYQLDFQNVDQYIGG